MLAPSSDYTRQSLTAPKTDTERQALPLVVQKPTNGHRPHKKYLEVSTVESKIRELRELRRMADELEAEITAIQDSIKAEMTATGVYEMSGTDYKVTWKEVTTSRIDTAALKKSSPRSCSSVHQDCHRSPLCAGMRGGAMMDNVKTGDEQINIGAELDELTEKLRAAAGMVRLCGRGITLNDGFCPSEDDRYAMDAACDYLDMLTDELRKLVDCV